MLAGAIREVYAMTSRRVHDIPMDDTTTVMFRLASGATASLLTMTATVSTYWIEVFATQGRALIQGAVDRRGSEALTITALDGAARRLDFDPVDLERAELEAFAAAIRGGSPFPISAEEVLNGVAVFEAVSLSAAAGAQVAIAEEQVV
jgi:predicted dehydrogenase